MKNLNKFLFSLCIIIVTSSCGNNDPVDGVTAPVNVKVSKVISSYIRLNFYESSRVPDESLLAKNDHKMLAFRPYSDGSIYFDVPDNQASFSNVSHLNNFEGREGVVDFAGAGSDMNAGPDLINNVKSFDSDGSFKQFTFGTWLYLDLWTPGSYLFKKEDSNGFLHCKMGTTSGLFEFNINGKTVNIQTTGLVGGWHHFALAYHGNNSLADRVTAYVDASPIKGINIASDFPTSVPFIKAPFHIGIGLDGKMDETFLNSLYLTNTGITNYKNNGIKLRNTDWNSTKTVAYWKFDESANIGKDSQSWKSIYNDIRSTIQGKGIKLRLGVTGGDWKTVFADASTRTNFVNNVYKIVSENNWDGVDFDFEWSATATEYDNYSKTIVELSNKLAPLKGTFSVSLHPYSYKINQSAINAVDFISVQLYGPSPTLFPYDQFVANSVLLVNYGIPANKLVLGVPFYGSESNGNKATESYYTFVNAGLITSPSLDELTYNGKTYTFNGQNTIRRKAQYVKTGGYLGLMSWDIATDASYTNNLSLLKVVNEELASK